MSYDLRADFERIVAGLCATAPRFYGRIGCHIDPAMLAIPEAKLIVEAVRAIAGDVGRGPDDDRLVLQRLTRWMHEGRVTRDDISDAFDLLDDFEDTGPHDIDLAAAELVPIIRRVKEHEIVKEAIDTYGKRGDMAEVAEKLGRNTRLGEVEGTLGIKLGPGVRRDIAALKHLARLPVGVTEIDSIIGGGAPRGRQMIFVGGPGEGKSMALSHMTARCSLVGGFNCYATLELHEAEVSARIIGHITGEPVTEILEMTSDLGFVKLDRWMPYLGPVYIKFFTPQATTVDDVIQWVKECEEKEGRSVDHLAVDYMDKLTTPTPLPKHEAMLQVGEGLRLFARDRDLWHTTASQRKTKSGKDRKRLTDVDDLADAQNKARVADLVITMNTDPDDDGMMIYNVAKNRSGPRGVTPPLPSIFELGRIAPVSMPRLPNE